MSSIIKSGSAIVKASNTSHPVAKTSAVAGAGGLALWAVAGLIPVLGVFSLSLLLFVAGVAFLIFGKDETD